MCARAIGRTHLSGRVPPAPEEQKARVVYSSGDSQWWRPIPSGHPVTTPIIQVRPFPPTLPPPPPAALGTGRDRHELTHEFPAHSLGPLSSGSQSAVLDQ